jgi:hypothetical protein
MCGAVLFFWIGLMPNEQPPVIEALRQRLSAVTDATGLFDAMAWSVGEYFVHPNLQRIGRDDPRAAHLKDPGCVQISETQVLVRRRTLDEADSGLFLLPSGRWNWSTAARSG